MTDNEKIFGSKYIDHCSISIPTPVDIKICDRALLTIRICSDGKREYLNHTGHHALVYFEKDSWWFRPSPYLDAVKCQTETQALDHFNDYLVYLRKYPR